MDTVQRPVNFRDLGGIKGAGGKRVKQGRLLRAGEISGLSEEEKERLQTQHSLALIIDLRGDSEVEKTPDELWGDIQYRRIDICKDINANPAAKINLEQVRPGHVDEYMSQLYRNMITDETARTGFREFLDILLTQGEGASVFHCYAGKDRTGVSAAIILTLLGASREDIFEDYLLTNALRAAANQALRREYLEQGLSEDSVESIMTAMGVKAEYLHAAYETAEKHYGSFEGFIREGLGVDEEQTAQLRAMYLTD